MGEPRDDLPRWFCPAMLFGAAAAWGMVAVILEVLGLVLDWISR